MKKHNKLKTFRVVFALVVIFLITLSLSDVNIPVVKEISRLFLKMQFVPAILRLITPGSIFVLAIFILLIITLLFGRVYCSMICPLGILQDLILFIRKKIFRTKRFNYSGPSNVIRCCERISLLNRSIALKVSVWVDFDCYDVHEIFLSHLKLRRSRCILIRQIGKEIHDTIFVTENTSAKPQSILEGEFSLSMYFFRSPSVNKLMLSVRNNFIRRKIFGCFNLQGSET